MPTESQSTRMMRNGGAIALSALVFACSPAEKSDLDALALEPTESASDMTPDSPPPEQSAMPGSSSTANDVSSEPSASNPEITPQSSASTTAQASASGAVNVPATVGSASANEHGSDGGAGNSGPPDASATGNPPTQPTGGAGGSFDSEPAASSAGEPDLEATTGGQGSAEATGGQNGAEAATGGAAPGAGGSPEPTLVPGDNALFDAAHEIFQTRCGSCHGADAERFGGPDRSAALRAAKVYDDEIARRISANGPDAMPPGGRLSADEVATITGWLDSY